ncbi:MAG: hypothetical protein ABGW74_01055 [Campylobacterales bacterium]
MQNSTSKDAFTKLVSSIIVDSAQTKIEVVKLQELLLKHCNLETNEIEKLNKSIETLKIKIESQISDVNQMLEVKNESNK